MCWLGLVIFLPLDWDAWRIISSSSSVDILLFSWFSYSPCFSFFFLFFFFLICFFFFFFSILLVNLCYFFLCLLGKICYWMQPFSSSHHQIPFRFFLLKFHYYNHTDVPLSLSLITFIIKVIITGSIFTSQAVNCPHFVSFRWRLNSKKICGEQKLNCPKFKSCQSVGCHSASLVA